MVGKNKSKHNPLCFILSKSLFCFGVFLSDFHSYSLLPALTRKLLRKFKCVRNVIAVTRNNISHSSEKRQCNLNKILLTARLYRLLWLEEIFRKIKNKTLKG